MDILENAEVKVGAVWGEIGEKIYRKFQEVLKRNPGYSTFIAVRKILNGEDTDPPGDISPGKFHLLKFTLVTSCDVERSFSAYEEFCLTGGYPWQLKIWRSTSWFTVYRNKHVVYYCSFILLTVTFWY
jgi:hypothetical protein